MQGLSAAQGGVANLGPGSQVNINNLKPTANTSLTWVRSNHTYKVGGEMIVEGYIDTLSSYANSWLVFSATESGLPSTNGQSLNGGTPGFPYASFLLGGVDNGYIGIPTKSRLGAHSFSGFAQDSWKITRKLTLDYGLRYDFQTCLKEQYGRIPYFSPSTPNPAAGNLPGAVAFEGYGPIAAIARWLITIPGPSARAWDSPTNSCRIRCSAQAPESPTTTRPTTG